MYGTSLTRFTPFGTTPNPLNAFNRAIEELFGDVARTGQETAARPWVPLVDVVETEAAFEIRAELPGIPKEAVEVSFENSVLTVKGERKLEKDVNKESYHRIERSYGTFARSFTLPSRVYPDKVEAKFENGLLTVVVPKADEVRPRKITIG